MSSVEDLTREALTNEYNLALAKVAKLHQYILDIAQALGESESDDSTLSAAMRVMRERDEARAEIERLRDYLARCREARRATAEGWRHEVAEVAAIVGAPVHTAELAAYVRAEVERLRAERDEARAQRDNLLDAAKEGAWMARALDAERHRDVLKDQLKYAESYMERQLLAMKQECDELRRERDEARHTLGRIAAVLFSSRAPLDDEELVEAMLMVIRERDDARAEAIAWKALADRSASACASPEAAAKLRAELASARAEIEMLRGVGYSTGDE